MQVIPVIDLKGGEAVLAHRGERDRYRPLRTALCPASDPLAVARAYLGLFPFPSLYIADLDAIQGGGDHDALVGRLEAAFPAVEFWVDRGANAQDDCRAWLERRRGRLVLGSESQRDEKLLETLREESGAGRPGARLALSLDFRGEAFQGPPVLLEEPALWPESLIVMTLGLVGSGEGPDLARIAGLQARKPEGRFYAAGGVRNAGDLARLSAAGVAGALVASCLHDGRVGPAELAALAENT